MPQLNPNPWLKFLLLSWIILLLPMTLITMSPYVNLPNLSMNKKDSTHWTWTWT